MVKDVIVWCIESSQGYFLKEVIHYAGGRRLVFTDRWDDNPMKFGTKSQAEKLKKECGLIWLKITDHMITNN